jgi:hypothetical protein
MAVAAINGPWAAWLILDNDPLSAPISPADLDGGRPLILSS